MASTRRTDAIGAQVEAVDAARRRTTAIGAQAESLLEVRRRTTAIGVMVEYVYSPISRTPARFLRFIIGDVDGVLREIPIDKINGIGLSYTEVDSSALQDSLHGALLGTPHLSLQISGPLDNSAAQTIASEGAAAVLSGSYDVLRRLNGLLVPRSFAMLIGMRDYWRVKMPVFGISSTAVDGCIVTEFSVIQNDEAIEYSARVSMLSGSAAPQWGTRMIA
jgi:hypothetical protein